MTFTSTRTLLRSAIALGVIGCFLESTFAEPALPAGNRAVLQAIAVHIKRTKQRNEPLSAIFLDKAEQDAWRILENNPDDPRAAQFFTPIIQKRSIAPSELHRLGKGALLKLSPSNLPLPGDAVVIYGPSERYLAIWYDNRRFAAKSKEMGETSFFYYPLLWNVKNPARQMQFNSFPPRVNKTLLQYVAGQGSDRLKSGDTAKPQLATDKGTLALAVTKIGTPYAGLYWPHLDWPVDPSKRNDWQIRIFRRTLAPTKFVLVVDDTVEKCYYELDSPPKQLCREIKDAKYLRRDIYRKKIETAGDIFQRSINAGSNIKRNIDNRLTDDTLLAEPKTLPDGKETGGGALHGKMQITFNRIAIGEGNINADGKVNGAWIHLKFWVLMPEWSGGSSGQVAKFKKSRTSLFELHEMEHKRITEGVYRDFVNRMNRSGMLAPDAFGKLLKEARDTAQSLNDTYDNRPDILSGSVQTGVIQCPSF